MKGKIKLLTAGLAALGAAAAVCWRLRRQSVDAVEAPSDVQCKTTEDQFLQEWTSILTDHARVFNGLFGGLHRVQNGLAKKPEKVLREWCQRTHYKWENQPVDHLCREQILPLIEAGDPEQLRKWTYLLLDAAEAAWITKDEAVSLVLTEDNAEAYIEWDGNELYPGAEVEILSPAWYQNGKVLEQGQCRKVADEER